MEKFTLVIGNKNYSSWSLRPWLILKQARIPFKEIVIPLYDPKYKPQLLKYSPTGKVPLLLHGRFKVWDSLAIAEYLAELFPQKNLWPVSAKERAWARAVSNEMHSGFVKLRKHMPMNVRGRHPGKGMTPEVERDIRRIQDIWNLCRRKFQKKGPFLFGPFTIADAMYAPVVWRFNTYGVKLSAPASAYLKYMLGLAAMKEWQAAGIKEPYVIDASELYSQK